MAPGTPAGWYPDPLGRHEQRFWDGAAWTTHVADRGVSSEDVLAESRPDAQPVEPTSVGPTSGRPAGQAVPGALSPDWYADPLGHADVRWWDGVSWTTHVATGGTPWEDSLSPIPGGVPMPSGTAKPERPRPSQLAVAGAAALGLIVLAIGLFIGLRLGGDAGGNDDGGDTTAVDVLGEGTPGVAATGFLDLGDASEPTTATVGADGATLTTPSGAELSVPEGAHSEPVSYTITERPIVGHSFGAAVTPASDLIIVDNGGGYADDVVELRIPAAIPAGAFAMGVFYDEATGRLEPLPLLDQTADHVTVATRHFSSIFVTYIDVVLLTEGTIDSGFRPGVDSWQYTNYGSYLEPSGHCSGQSLSALWYYTEQRLAQSAPALFGRYDDRIDARKRPGTPLLQWDDNDGYRLATMVQRDQYAGGMSTYEKKMDKLAEARLATLQFHAFAYSILLTGEPQYVGIMASSGGGHAMIVYGVTADRLLVADPNYPKAYQFIPYDPAAGTLGPYQAKSDASSPSKPYDIIGYYAKSALVDWNGLGGRWQEFLDGTIGDAQFLDGALQVREVDDAGRERWVPLTDGYKVPDDVATISVRRDAPTFNERLRIYRWDQALATSAWDNPVAVPLVKGANRLGVETWGYAPNGSTEWVSFIRLDVIRGELDEPDLDLVFVIDLTSSMEDDIAGVKAAATNIVHTVATTNDDWRVAIVGYRDVGDTPMYEDYPFSSDEAAVVANIGALSVFGGGDEPEAVLEALSRAIDAGSIGGWRDGFPNKQIILMGDAPGHVPGSGGETHASVAREAELADPVVIQSVVVGNAGFISPEAEADFNELSELTGGSVFTAADAEAVPEALEETIGSIGDAPVPAAGDDGSSGWLRTLLVVISAVLVAGGASVLAWRLLRPPLPALASSEVTP